MFKNREKLYQAYHTVLSIALSWALALAINQYYNLKVKIVVSALFCIIPAILIYLFDLNRRNAISYILLFSVIPIVGLIFLGLRLNPIKWFKDLVNWIMSYNGTEELYKGYHAKFILFAVALAGLIICYLLMKQQAAKIVLAVLLMVTLIILSISKVDINKAVVGICIFYILTIMVEVFGVIYGKKAGKQDKREGILYLAPICLLLAILSISLPSKEEPIQWKGIKQLYSNIKEQIEIWQTDWDFYFGKSSSEFAVALTGYSDESGNLSNNSELIKDSKIALKVSGSKGNNPVYLIGSVSDIYTGYSWDKSKLDYTKAEEEYQLDYNELIYALSREPIEALENNRYLEQHIMKTEYNYIKTKTFFYPLKTSRFNLIGDRTKVDTAYANMTMPKVKGKGTNYEVTFYGMNLQGDAFQQMLRNAEGFSYDAPPSLNLKALQYIQNMMISYDSKPKVLKRWNCYEILRDRSEMIKKQFTVLPDTLPNRVRDLAVELTKNYDNKYDKLKAIEIFLQQYEYSLEAIELSETQDFVDYFLFESKKGYCTSFATAMAVLGRCVGIPTRFVEGFVAKYDDKDDQNMFLVKNSQAHAWCEAYIEGVGWIPFEATAPFYNYRYTKWRELQKPASVVAPDYTSRYIQEELQDMLGLNGGGTVPQPEKEDNVQEILTAIIVFFAIILLLILFFIIYYYILKYRYKKEFEQADYTGRMYMLFLRTLRLLRREGYSLDQQETILMLSKRVKDMFHYDKVTFPVVANIFMRYRYAGVEVTKEELEQVEVYHRGLANKRREEVKRFMVWMDEFIFLARKNYR